MGLDMNLYAFRYVPQYGKEGKLPPLDLTSHNMTEVKGEVRFVLEDVMYWRKANAIHGWFVQHCAGGTDDCQPVLVLSDQLHALLRDIRIVLKDPRSAMMLLPPMSGFFFGPAEVGEAYMADLHTTEAKLSELLGDPAQYASNYLYWASW